MKNKKENKKSQKESQKKNDQKSKKKKSKKERKKSSNGKPNISIIAHEDSLKQLENDCVSATQVVIGGYIYKILKRFISFIFLSFA